MLCSVTQSVQLFETPRTLAHQARFSRQEHWGGLPCPPPGDLPNPGTELPSPAPSTLTDEFFITGKSLLSWVPPQMTLLERPSLTAPRHRPDPRYFLTLSSSDFFFFTAPGLLSSVCLCDVCVPPSQGVSLSSGQGLAFLSGGAIPVCGTDEG